MNKYTILTAVVGMLLLAFVVAPKVSQAYRGDPSVQGPNYTEERHTAMTKAFADKDYPAWKEQMQGRGRITQVITANNFDKFAYAHQLMLEGKTEEAQAIRAELGLGLQNGSGRGQGNGRGCQAR